MFAGGTMDYQGISIADAVAWIFYNSTLSNLASGEKLVIDPTTSTFYSSSTDGYLQNYGTNYATVHDADSGTIIADDAAIDIAQERDDMDWYFIKRGFVYFDTSNIPDGTTITSAYLQFTTWTVHGTNFDGNLTIQNGQPTYPHYPLQETDYNHTHYSGNGGTTVVNFGDNETFNIVMTTDGLTWINKAGTTKLCLRLSEDIDATQPPSEQYHDVYVWSREAEEQEYRPKLVVTYIPYTLNLRIIDWNNDIIVGATVYANESTLNSDSDGWAIFTGYDPDSVVNVKVKYQNVWVNGTFSVTMDSDKTIDVKCKVYRLTVYVTNQNGVEMSGATLSLARSDGENLTSYGLTPKTVDYYNTTHGRYVWTQLANQTASYTVKATVSTGESNSTTTALTENTQKTIVVTTTISGGPGGPSGGPSFPPVQPPPSLPPVEVPKVPGEEFNYGIIVLVGVVGIATTVAVFGRGKPSLETRWKNKTKHHGSSGKWPKPKTRNLSKKWRKKAR